MENLPHYQSISPQQWEINNNMRCYGDNTRRANRKLCKYQNNFIWKNTVIGHDWPYRCYITKGRKPKRDRRSRLETE
jgi:hypothetical protein